MDRRQVKQQAQSSFCSFPDELWVEVLSHLEGKDIGRAVCSTRMFADERDLIWRKACEKRWPVWARVARAPDTQWKRQFELLELRQREQVVIPSIATIQRIQKVVTGRHREVLTEWLAEVTSTPPSTAVLMPLFKQVGMLVLDPLHCLRCLGTGT